jgi:hypothetical protein
MIMWRNHTSNFAFWALHRLAICITVLSLQQCWAAAGSQVPSQLRDHEGKPSSLQFTMMPGFHVEQARFTKYTFSTVLSTYVSLSGCLPHHRQESSVSMKKKQNGKIRMKRCLNSIVTKKSKKMLIRFMKILNSIIQFGKQKHSKWMN